MKTIKLIALDMDGTTLTNDKQIAPETFDAIQYAKSKGIKVMIATGRPYQECYPFAKQLQLEDYLIVSNGAEIWDMNEKLIERSEMDQQLIEKLWRIGENHQAPMWVISTEKVHYSNNPPIDFSIEKWLKIGYAYLDKLTKSEIMKELAYFEDALEITNSYVDNIEVNKKGINKATAIKKICDEEGILLEEILVAGDGLNDEKMIIQAGIGVAMGNGQEVIKQIADYVTDTNENHGVAKAIYKFVK